MKKLGQRLRACFAGMGIFAKINLSIISLLGLTMVLLIVLLNRFTLIPSLEKDKLLNKEATLNLHEIMLNKYNIVYNQYTLLLNTREVSTVLASAALYPEKGVDYEGVSRISSYLQTLLYSDSDILDTVLLSESSETILSRTAQSTRRLSVRYEDFAQLPEVTHLLNSERNICVSYGCTEGYVHSEDIPVVTFAVKLYNPLLLPTRQVIGVLLINYPVAVFNDAYQQLGALSDGQVYVLSDTDEIIYANDERLYGTHYEPDNTAELTVTAYAVGVSGVRVLNCVSDRALRKATAEMVRTLLCIVVPAMFVMLCVVVLLNRRYQQKLSKLASAMQEIANGGLSVRLPIEQEDEIGRLSGEFNRMCERLEVNIHMNYQAEVARRTAELNALQAQINPHFLFNTIEGIRMRALESGAPDVAEMLMKFGNLFHWMISMDQRIVYLEDELDYNESYLSLQKMRYEDSFDSTFDVPDELLYMGIPKFTLQPIVENALLHGLKENGLRGRIRVTVREENGILVLRVCNNGAQMPPEQLERLQAHIEGRVRDPQFGIGMRNVHSRIQLMFGADYGVRIRNTTAGETEVTVTFPAASKRDMERRTQQIQIQQEETL